MYSNKNSLDLAVLNALVQYNEMLLAYCNNSGLLNTKKKKTIYK